MTPKEFPPHNIVFYYFTKWKREGVFEDIMDTLREKLRKILADGGYMGEELKELVRKTLGCNLEVVLRPNESHKSSISSLEMNCRKVFRLAVQLQEGCLGLRVLLRILQGHDSNRLLKNHV
jgi:transposase